MRALIILLALLLPMQLSWAAMASYCQAENDRAPAHVGHHEHPAAATAAADENAGSGKSKTGDSDTGCSLCHFCCMKSVQIGRLSVAAPPLAEQKSPPGYFPHPASHIADGPDKPNWPLAA
ncbi:cobalt transporter [Herbaspirillum sp. LeCh32-8]|uniref:cobalt transporter n=1 Tax=Herbaspirillum sp. LeCh32-8 TaxID=2821356 RepID=UPI001AE215D2|nr:cobalt transporter [Herbaspirillum sp. LeCh32-8]MBP0598092.1 cobalt transporter [Herbaspirillum sp. LeCh32-8]